MYPCDYLDLFSLIELVSIRLPRLIYIADIDECKKGSHDCDVNATCINTVGGHNCTCKEGFSGCVSEIINCKLFVIYFYSILFRTWPSWELVRPTTLIGKMHYPWFLTQKIRPSLSVTRQICTPVSPTIITLLHYGEITSAVIINIIG